MKNIFLFFISVSLMISFSLNAHHSDASYNQDETLTLQGIVSSYVWRNPHVIIYVEAPDANGNIVEWALEIGNTMIMTRSGWSRDLLKNGDLVQATVYPNRNPENHDVMLINIQTADGSIYIQDESDYIGSSTANNLEGVWKGRGSSIIAFSQAMSEASLTEKGSLAKNSYDYRLQSPIAQCVPPPTPTWLRGMIIYLTEFEITEDRVVIRNEFFDNQRIVYMDGRDHPETGSRTNQGHSIGFWDGDTLVVDTVLFEDHPSSFDRGVPNGSQKHTIERFYLNEEGNRMIVDIFVEDPEYLKEPFSGSMQLDYTPEYTIQEYNCDPEFAGFDRYLED